MNWDTLRFILAAHRAKTLTGAAAELGVTHTTVARRIRSCEEDLGACLFERTSEGLYVTAAGQDLVAVAEMMESAVLEAEARILGRDAALRGPLRVSILDYTFWGLHEAFTGFMERYPHVELTLTAQLDPVSLFRREADIALRLTNAPPETLMGRCLGELGFAVYGSVDLVERVGSQAPLGAYPWVGWDERLGARWFEDWLDEHAPGARVVVRIDESAILRRQAVVSGMGLFLMPCLEADAIAGLRRLGPVRFRRQLWLLTLMELRHTSRVQAFFEHMVGALAPWKDRMAGGEGVQSVSGVS